MSRAPVVFRLPDLIGLCPLKGKTNPFYQKARDESARWIEGFHIFSDRKRLYFIYGLNELLVSHTYPYAQEYQMRTVCDFVNLLFVVDEKSDEQDGPGARATCSTFLNVMVDPAANDETPLAMMTRQFRSRCIKHTKPKAFQRFLQHCRNYVDAVVREAELRDREEVLDLDAFIPFRRENSAIRLCFALIEYAYGIELPDEVFEDHAFNKAYEAGMDLVCWANDLYSYNMEQAKGHAGNNVVTVLMNDKRITLQEACDLVGERWEQTMRDFMDARNDLLETRADSDVLLYLDGIAHWIRGNLDWSFQSERYFGREHGIVKTTLTVTLRPNGPPEDMLQSDGEGNSA